VATAWAFKLNASEGTGGAETLANQVLVEDEFIHTSCRYSTAL
jgi:hypothetical protein